MKFVVSVFAAILLMHFCALSAYAVTQTLYMPILQAADSGDIGLALSNPTLADVTVTLTARDYAGVLISGTGVVNPATMTLPASGQRSLRAMEIFGAGISGKVGWVELQSSSAAVKGFFLVFDSRLSFIDGAELQTRPASRLVFPKMSGNPASPTIISYVNTGTDTLRFAALSFYENSGRLVAKTYLTLAPKSGFTGSIIAALPDAAGHEGYAVLETGTPLSGLVEALVGFETYRNSTDVAALNAVPDTAASRISYLPHFVTGGGYTTRLSLVNFTNESQTLTITAGSLETACAAQGPSAVATRSIPPNGRLEETANSLFSLSGSALCAGYIKWETPGNSRGVIGYLDYGTTDGVLLSAVSAQSTSYSDLFFSQIAQGLGYYTGIALLNPNTQTSTISIDAFEKDGHKVAGTTVTLIPGQRRAQLFSELFPGLGTQLGGYVHVSASRPIFAFQLFGSSASLSFLANVSVQGIQLQPQVSGRVVSAAAGANVLSADTNASIAILPGALLSDTAVSLNSVTVTLPPPSSTQQVIASVDAQPTGTVFNIPVRLTLPLSAQLPPGTPVPVLIYTAQGTYQDSGFIAIVDDSGRTASAQVSHFTTFALSMSTDLLISVTSVSPTNGPAGATVSIGGSGFSTNAADNIVTFAGPENTSVTGSVTAATSTSLTLTVPSGAITGAAIVKVGARTSTGIKFTVFADRPKPSLSSILPAAFPAGTTAAEIAVTGTGFQNASVVRIDGAPVTTTFVDATLIRVSISGAQVVPGVHKVTVFTPAETGGTGGGESGFAEVTFGLPMPRIVSLSPSTAASANGSVTVTISGIGFASSSTVTVNDVGHSATFVSSTSMTLIVNSDKAINLPIVVSNPSPAGGSSGAAVFVFSGPPVGPMTLSVLSDQNPSGNVNTSVSMQIEVRKGGVPLANYPVSFSIWAGNGSVTPAETVTDSQGRASATLTLGTFAGTNTIGVRAGDLSSSFSATGTASAPPSSGGGGGAPAPSPPAPAPPAPGPAAKLALSTGGVTTLAAGSAANLTVTIQDASGNTLTSATNPITITSNITGSVIGAVVGPSGGVATSTFTGQLAGSYIITASSGTLTAATANISVSAGPAASLVHVSGDGQSAVVGNLLPASLVVKAADAFGNLVQGVAVTFASILGGGSVGTANATTNSSGQAGSTATLGALAGLNKVTASAAGLAGSPVTFSETATNAVPAFVVTITAGNAQTVAPGISLLTPLKVHVTDLGGIPVPNATVNWLAASGGGSVAAGTSLTNASGDATMTATAGPSAGANTFTATVSGVAPETFTATATVLASSPASVDVQISSAAIGVGSFQLQINFDATKVQVSPSNVVVGNGAGYLLVAVNPDNNAGTLIINGFSTSVPAGNYTVAHVTFTPIRPGSVTLSTTGVVVTDINGLNVSSGFLSLSQTGLTIN